VKDLLLLALREWVKAPLTLLLPRRARPELCPEWGSASAAAKDPPLLLLRASPAQSTTSTQPQRSCRAKTSRTDWTRARGGQQLIGGERVVESDCCGTGGRREQHPERFQQPGSSHFVDSQNFDTSEARRERYGRCEGADRAPSPFLREEFKSDPLLA
jgi:hypothetical protein